MVHTPQHDLDETWPAPGFVDSILSRGPHFELRGGEIAECRVIAAQQRNVASPILCGGDS
jgi:hypothetical protein